MYKRDSYITSLTPPDRFTSKKPDLHGYPMQMRLSDDAMEKGTLPFFFSVKITYLYIDNS